MTSIVAMEVTHKCAAWLVAPAPESQDDRSTLTCTLRLAVLLAPSADNSRILTVRGAGMSLLHAESIAPSVSYNRLMCITIKGFNPNSYCAVRLTSSPSSETRGIAHIDTILTPQHNSLLSQGDVDTLFSRRDPMLGIQGGLNETVMSAVHTINDKYHGAMKRIVGQFVALIRAF